MWKTKGSDIYYPEAKACVSLCILDGKWYKLTSREQSIIPDHATDSLDVAVLQNSLLRSDPGDRRSAY